MGYQALLFCPDEKLARVVSQVFSELDFTIDPVSEPFAAVKKLMAQHYDAIVVDCDNDQNSSLLLKSARTSTLNQGSLAIAVVEGQAGVARAYRIGANLVLTKPINLEQTKGTLRVARGLLRKNSDAAAAAAAAPSPIPAAATPAAPAPAPAASIAAPAETPNRIHQVVAGTSLHGQSPEFANPLPTMAASKPEPEVPPVAAPVQKVVAPTPLPVSPAAREVAKSPVTMPTPAPVAVAPSSTQGAASAPAPAKEIVVPARKVTEKENTDALPEMEAAPQATSGSGSTMAAFGAPSFGALDDDNAGGSGSKKVLIAAAVILVVAAAGYFGWNGFGQSHPTPAPQAAASLPQTPSAPAVVPNTEPASAPAITPSSAPTASNRTSTISTTSANRTSPILATTTPKPSAVPPVQQAAAPSSSSSQGTLLQNEAKTAASSPIVVKSGNSTKQEPVEAPPAQLPSPLAMAAPGDNRVGGILSSASTSVAKPSLSTLKISQGVSQGMVIKRVQPKYPANALAAHIQGAVQIEATVNKEGKVVNPKVLSGEPTLAAAALDAVKQWRYKPYYLDGEPVEIQTQITINFKAN